MSERQQEIDRLHSQLSRQCQQDREKLLRIARSGLAVKPENENWWGKLCRILKGDGGS